MYKQALKSLLGAALLAGAGFAHAVPFDFTTLGAENTLLPNSVTVGGVTAAGFSYAGGNYTAQNLWLRNVPNDHGLGICSEGASCATGGGDVNEIDNSGNYEVLRLSRPSSSIWTSLWVSSHDGGGSGGSEAGTIYWSNSAAPDLSTLTGFTFEFPAFGGSAVEGDLFSMASFAGSGFNPAAQYLFWVAGDPNNPNTGDNNDYLMWKGVTEPGDPPTEIPEPGGLLLVGTLLVGLGASRKLIRR